MSARDPFSRLVTEAMDRRGLGLRELCRLVDLDPSFFSKVLTGKRSPPADEAVLKRLAGALETDPVELVVSAGRIPSEWADSLSDPSALRRVSALLGSAYRPAPKHVPTPAAPRAAIQKPVSKNFSEELL